jgi:hypothetical protein
MLIESRRSNLSVSVHVGLLQRRGARCESAWGPDADRHNNPLIPLTWVGSFRSIAPIHTAMSMARLWRDQGKRDKARELLASVYGWFTEGSDTLDLKQARALLTELA